MVTTRSAERQASVTSKRENLALRSKHDETDVSEQNSDADVDTPESSRRKARVLVNVPPPRKRSRLNYDGADDVEKENVVTEPTAADSNDTKRPADAEIPDSQDSPLKSDPIKHSEPLVDMFALDDDDDESPESTAGTKRKRETIENHSTPQESTTDAPPAAVSAEHKRFGSEELLEHDVSQVDTDRVDMAGDSFHQDEDDFNEDVDDAPEVVSTKRTSKATTSRAKRKVRGKKDVNVNEALLEQSESPNAEIGKAGSGAVEGETTQAITVPNLSIDTSQDPNTTLALESEDSNDSAFVTARTTRHVDAFATPTSGTPQIRSPTTETSILPHGRIRSVKLISEDPVVSGSIDLDSTPGRLNASSVTLPSKAGNTLEQYRRQTLASRTEKGSSKSRGSRFKLQEEWSGKRRKFVVGY